MESSKKSRLYKWLEISSSRCYHNYTIGKLLMQSQDRLMGRQLLDQVKSIYIYIKLQRYVTVVCIILFVVFTGVRDSIIVVVSSQNP